MADERAETVRQQDERTKKIAAIVEDMRLTMHPALIGNVPITSAGGQRVLEWIARVESLASPVPSHEDSHETPGYSRAEFERDRHGATGDDHVEARQETPKVDLEKCDGCEFRNRFGLHLMRDGRRLCGGCLVKIPNHWDQRERRRQTAPTAWAYQQADAAVWKHRARADAAEAECSRLRDEKEAIEAAILEAHARLDAAGIPSAAGTRCDDPTCDSQLVHRVHVALAGKSAAEAKAEEAERCYSIMEADVVRLTDENVRRLAVLRELVEAGDFTVSSGDIVASMLRFGKATDAARAELRAAGHK